MSPPRPCFAPESGRSILPEGAEASSGFSILPEGAEADKGKGSGGFDFHQELSRLQNRGAEDTACQIDLGVTPENILVKGNTEIMIIPGVKSSSVVGEQYFWGKMLIMLQSEAVPPVSADI